MTFRYTIVSYRPNGASYCRGHYDRETNSDFTLMERETFGEAVDALSGILYTSETAEVDDYKHSYGERETYVFVNGCGVDGDRYDEDILDVETPDGEAARERRSLAIEARRVSAEARKTADALVAKKKAIDEAAAAEAKAAKEASERESDLLRLEALKKKLGMP
jgi:hypothetical protein